jgi:hypothetical protein
MRLDAKQRLLTFGTGLKEGSSDKWGDGMEGRVPRLSIDDKLDFRFFNKPIYKTGRAI